MHEHQRIKNVLAPLLAAEGFIEVDENWRPDVFGSAYTTFSNGRRRVRLVWDGKDGWATLTLPDDGYSLGPSILEGEFGPRGEYVQKAQAMAEQVRAWVNSKA